VDGAALVRRALGWLWGVAIVCSALDLHFGRKIGPISSGWDDLAVASLVVALLATLLGLLALPFSKVAIRLQAGGASAPP
jgi:hypothetical protein